MKVKRLKDVEFSYIPGGGKKPGDFKTHFEIRQGKLSKFLTKREALSFVNWFMNVADLTEQEWHDLYNNTKDNYLHRINK